MILDSIIIDHISSFLSFQHMIPHAFCLLPHELSTCKQDMSNKLNNLYVDLHWKEYNAKGPEC